MRSKEIVNVKELTRVLERPGIKDLTINSKFSYPSKSIDITKINKPKQVVDQVLDYAENFPHSQVVVLVNVVSQTNVNVMVSPVVGSA